LHFSNLNEEENKLWKCTCRDNQRLLKCDQIFFKAYKLINKLIKYIFTNSQINLNIIVKWDKMKWNIIEARKWKK